MSSASRATASRWIGFAACLLAGLGLGRYTSKSESPANLLIANPTRVVIDTMRGNNSAPMVDFANGKSPYLFVEVSIPPGSKRIRVVHAGKETALLPSREGFVGFLVARTDLSAKPEVTIKYLQDGRELTRELQLPTKGAP